MSLSAWWITILMLSPSTRLPCRANSRSSAATLFTADGGATFVAAEEAEDANPFMAFISGLKSKCRSFIFTPTCYVLCDTGGNNLTNVVLKWKIKRREGNKEGESSEWNIRGDCSMFINYWQTFIALFKIREEYMNVMIFCYRLYVFKFHVLIRFIGGIQRVAKFQ